MIESIAYGTTSAPPSPHGNRRRVGRVGAGRVVIMRRACARPAEQGLKVAEGFFSERSLAWHAGM
ncbi:hypothetical protein GCM10029964_036290 [Kibdelosporangium lantanae]